MGRKKVEEKEEGAYWMDTYGDMVTLLLTFFVLLFAMSSLDKDKWEIFVKAFQNKFSTEDQMVIILDPDAEEVGNEDVKPSGETPTVGNQAEEITEIDDVEAFDDLYLFLKKYFEDQGMKDSVTLHSGDGFVYISFDNSIFFAGDDYQLLPNTRALLGVVCQVLTQIEPQIGEVHSHGHTAQEFADRPNNIPFDRTLSSNRATQVAIFIEQNSTVTGERIKSTGHGQHMPLKAHDGTEDTRQLNRRCELVIAKAGEMPPTLTEIYELINNPDKYADIDGLPPVVSSPTKPKPPTETPSVPASTPSSAPSSDITSDTTSE